MQGCVISCGTEVFFQRSRNLSWSLLTNNNLLWGAWFPFHKEQSNGHTGQNCKSSFLKPWGAFGPYFRSKNLGLVQLNIGAFKSEFRNLISLLWFGGKDTNATFNVNFIQFLLLWFRCLINHNHSCTNSVVNSPLIFNMPKMYETQD